jgi:hypothetical protein
MCDPAEAGHRLSSVADHELVDEAADLGRLRLRLMARLELLPVLLAWRDLLLLLLRCRDHKEGLLR